MKMWYAKPSGVLGERTLLLGNGIIGASVFGGIDQEKILLNHTHLWRHAKTKGRVNPECASYLPKIRELFFDGKMIEATDMAYRTLGTQWNLNVFDNYYGPDPFVPAGQVELHYDGCDSAKDYRSELNLMTGVGTVEYCTDETSYLHTYITPMKDLGFAGRLTAQGKEKVNVTIGLSRIEDDECQLRFSCRDHLLVMEGEFFEGIHYSLALKVRAEGGTVTTIIRDGKPLLCVCGAYAVELYSSIATMMQGNDLTARVEREVNELEKLGFSSLLQRHEAAFASYMERINIQLKAPDVPSAKRVDTTLPTDERMLRYVSGEDDPELMAIYYQYGRYTTLCSSINGGFPSNLNGIWCEELHPSCNADFHHDINSEAPYWMAETTNLSETTEALFQYVEWLLPEARKAAKDLYGCGGIYIPLTTGGWPECLKLEASWDEWTGAAAWLAQHFWQHWDFTRDKKFLEERCYPYLKEVAQFYLDYLVPDPRKDHRFYGKLQAVPSYSPENGFREGGLAPVSLSISCAMDIELINEVMEHVIAASEILAVDTEQRQQWQYVLDNLPPLEIGRQGNLKEWQEEWDEDWNIQFTEGIGHRHSSHLYALFPGENITATKTPELYEACKKSVDIRIANGSGEHFPWLYAALYARLKMPSEAYQNLRAQEMKCYPRNPLFFWGQRPVMTATMTEMILQSHDEFIELLPALPDQWASGAVTGLVARGGFECDIAWENYAVKEFSITAKVGGECMVVWQNQRHTLKMAQGEKRTITFA